MSAQINNIRPEFDREIVDIVDYVMNYEISSRVAYDTAHITACSTRSAVVWKLSNIRPVKTVGANCPRHRRTQRCARPRNSVSARPVRAAFNIGAMIRWLDFNDTAGGGSGASFRQPRRHSGNGRLAFAQRGRQRQSAADHETGADRMIKAHEIQGCIALENSFNASASTTFC